MDTSRTLGSRLARLVIAFVSTISLGFVLLTFFVLYGLEDAALNRQADLAAQSYTMNGALPLGASVIGATELPDDLEPIPVVGDYGEGYSDGRYFHYKRIAENDYDAYLLLDATDQLVVRRSVADLLLIFGFVSAVVLVFSLVASRWFSSIALRPFERLVQLVSEGRLGEGEEAIREIGEADVRMLAENFRRVLAAKQSLVREQIDFNQGISHELRTPLQIIKHSLELLQDDIQGIDREPSFERMKRATRRMERISSAFLWLTTSDAYDAESSVADCAEAVLAELDQTLNEQQIRADLRIESDMFVQVPTPVLELMLYNLVSNVARHARHADLSVTIDENAVTLENPVINGSTAQDGFHLGLNIVRSLAGRFGLDFAHSEQDQVFRTRISKVTTP